MGRKSKAQKGDEVMAKAAPVGGDLHTRMTEALTPFAGAIIDAGAFARMVAAACGQSDPNVSPPGVWGIPVDTLREALDRLRADLLAASRPVEGADHTEESIEAALMPVLDGFLAGFEEAAG